MNAFGRRRASAAAVIADRGGDRPAAKGSLARRARARRPAVWVLSAVVVACAGCASDNPQQPAATTPTTIVDASQGPGGGGNSNNGDPAIPDANPGGSTGNSAPAAGTP